MNEPTAADLRRATRSELEAFFRHERAFGVPTRAFAGETLCRLDNPGARDLRNQLPQWLLFDAIPFGVDFERNLWFFFGKRRLAGGRFEVRVGPSRWRDTDVLQLHYTPSRLPEPVRDVLYDEVKPLSPHLLLGLGGTNAERDAGDHFFFLLS